MESGRLSGLQRMTADTFLDNRYNWLDVIIKLLMVMLSVSTVIATVLALPLIDWLAPQRLLAIEFTPGAMFVYGDADRLDAGAPGLGRSYPSPPWR